MNEVLKLDAITRRYREGQLEVFSNLNLTVKAGEIVALVGPSGAGKSSLLHIAGLLEAPTSGEIFIEGVGVSGLADSERTRIRRDKIGFVYQAHHLLPGSAFYYEMDGEPLEQAHGAPLRLVMPIKYGYKGIKRIGTIWFTNDRPNDFWAEQGYDWYAGH